MQLADFAFILNFLQGTILPYPPLEMENFSLMGTYKEIILTKPQIVELILIEEDKEYDPSG